MIKKFFTGCKKLATYSLHLELSNGIEVFNNSLIIRPLTIVLEVVWTNHLKQAWSILVLKQALLPLNPVLF